MSDPTAEQVSQRIFDLNLVEGRLLQEVWGTFGSLEPTVDEFIQALVRRELLTNWQTERLLKGERGGYYYGDYKIQYLISAGTFARVYRAVNVKTGKVVAVKVLRRRFSEDPKQTDQFVREGEMGKSLRHSNIVPIYEVHSINGNHFLVMEFVEGGNLRDLLRIRRKIDPKTAVQIASDVCAGLHYAFERGVCHRDLKLTNILFTSRMQGKLVDFGLAAADERFDDEKLADETNQRTIDYAGLERATGVRKDDVRSDVYFIGCILYHMLTGQPPLIETRDRIQRLSKQRFVDVTPIHRQDSSIPKPLAQVVNKAMELDPEKRYQSPGLMLVDLKIVAQRLADGKLGEEAGDDGELGSDAERQRLAAMLIPESQRKAIMFVESNSKMQDMFREGIKSCGYRVLLTSDPQRALDRFDFDERTADCVVFSTGYLKQPALDAFRSFVTGEKTRRVPAVLLLGQKQHGVKPGVDLQPHHQVVSMPLKLRQLRDLLGKLAPLQTTSA